MFTDGTGVQAEIRFIIQNVTDNSYGIIQEF